MLVYPEINPVALTLGSVAIYWYGVLYLIGFIGFIALGILRRNAVAATWTINELYDLCFYIALGVIFGGRFGMIFYTPEIFIAEPLNLLKFWEPGRSFHGGLLGVIVAVLIYCRLKQRNFWQVTDFIVPMVPVAIACGRLGNFINGELWGRVTTVPWAMIFPHVDRLPRHPSQLYELLLEGVLLFIILWFYSAKKPKVGRVTGVFLLLYGVFRIIVECFRTPDLDVGFIIAKSITMGQLLSTPMIILGIFLIAKKSGE